MICSTMQQTPDEMRNENIDDEKQRVLPTIKTANTASSRDELYMQYPSSSKSERVSRKTLNSLSIFQALADVPGNPGYAGRWLDCREQGNEAMHWVLALVCLKQMNTIHLQNIEYYALDVKYKPIRILDLVLSSVFILPWVVAR